MGITYSVEVQYLSTGNFDAPAKSMKQLKSDTDKWNASLGRGASSFASGFDSAVSSVGGMMLDMAASAATAFASLGVAGFALATKAVFNFNEEMENTVISLGAIANANGLSNGIVKGMEDAKMSVAEMRKDARDLPGEFKDLANIMTTIATPAAQAGMSLKDIEKFAAKTMTLAAITQVPQAVAAREMAMMLSGNARHNMPLFNRMGMGMSTTEFNALMTSNPTAGVGKLNTSMGKFDPALGAVKGSWEVIKSTGIDNVRQGLGFLGKPLFDSVKSAVGRFNQWATGEGQAKVRELGSSMQLEFAFAIRAAEHGISHWYPIIKTFGQHLGAEIKSAWSTAAPLIHQAAEGLEKFMKDPQALTKLEDFGKSMIALKAGSTAMSMGMSIGAEAGPAGVLAALAAGAALYGLTSAVLDTSSAFHDFAVTHLKSTASNLTKMGETINKTDGILQAWGSAVVGYMDYVTTVWASSFDGLSTAVSTLTTAFTNAADIFNIVAHGIAPSNGSHGILLDKAYDVLNTVYGANRLNPDEPIKNDHAFPEYSPTAKSSDDLNDVMSKIKPHVTNIHGGIHINVQGNADPFRTARAAKDLIGDLANHPKVAAVTDRGY